MALVNKVGRRTWKARLAMLALYAILTAGAITTLYPFLLMISYSLKGATDQDDTRLAPRYFQETGASVAVPDKESLMGKYLDDKYSGDKDLIASTRSGASANAALVTAYESFLENLPLDDWVAGYRTVPPQLTSQLSQRYESWLQTRYRDIQDLNRAYGEQNTSFQQVAPPAERFSERDWKPEPTLKWSEWLQFKQSLPTDYRLPVRAQRIFQQYWNFKTEGQFANVPPALAKGATGFDDMALPATGAWRAAFDAARMPLRYQKETVEDRWNRTAPGRPMPIAASESAYVVSHATELRQDFAVRNYRFVLDYLLRDGGVLLNTVTYCGLAVLAQLTVNPLAAYALSRYPIRGSYKILVFLLATMAFPAEVAMIPSFLLLKDLGLLNTFAALVLPGAASGYMIYLLKGFFDSLPAELFEAGQIDGASETRLMVKVALPLTRPVLGYLALLAFMGAYGAFMYAFLVAQDRRIWTIMVYIYELQSRSAPESVMMAALTLAAVPTLLVFLFSQQVILKGMVLPGER